MSHDDSRAKDRGWRAIFDQYNIGAHNFDCEPFPITANEIKRACVNLKRTSEKEPRLLCTQTSREMRPDVFRERNLFILPIKNGKYVIVRGEGYVDIPEIKSAPVKYSSKLDFSLDTPNVGDSEMQHLDYAYAVSMLRDFMDDPSLVMTIRGRKYTPEFSFEAGGFPVKVESVQTEVDSGYEGRDRVVLVEAKNSSTMNTIIRQLYYPYRQWGMHTSKPVFSVFFEHRGNEYHFWLFSFSDPSNYNSIKLEKSVRYLLV